MSFGRSMTSAHCNETQEIGLKKKGAQAAYNYCCDSHSLFSDGFNARQNHVAVRVRICCPRLIMHATVA